MKYHPHLCLQKIHGVSPIPDGYNPATWMLEVTTPAAEQRIGADFADIYRNSQQFRWIIFIICKWFLYLAPYFHSWICSYYTSRAFCIREVEASIEQMSTPPPGSEPLKFDTVYSQDGFSQLMTSLWKQNLVYWRSPHYNAVRIFFTTLSALILGTVFWDVGSKR